MLVVWQAALVFEVDSLSCQLDFLSATEINAPTQAAANVSYLPAMAVAHFLYSLLDSTHRRKIAVIAFPMKLYNPMRHFTRHLAIELVLEIALHFSTRKNRITAQSECMRASRGRCGASPSLSKHFIVAMRNHPLLQLRQFTQLFIAQRVALAALTVRELHKLVSIDQRASPLPFQDVRVVCLLMV